MRPYFMQTLLLFFVLLSGVAPAQNGQEIRIPLSDSGKKGKLSVALHKGPITVKGTPRQDVLVRYKTLEDSAVKLSDAGNGLKKISGGMPGLEIVEQDNEVQIESESWNKGLELYIEVPEKFDLDLEAYMMGGIEIESVTGEIAVENYNGPITARNISGSLIADTYNGKIEVTFTSVNADAPMAFNTYNGDVDLTLPGATKADLKLKTENGDIYTGFELNVAASVIRNENEDGRYFIGGWITGQINGGGSEIKAMTYQGDIYIRKK